MEMINLEVGKLSVSTAGLVHCSFLYVHADVRRLGNEVKSFPLGSRIYLHIHIIFENGVKVLLYSATQSLILGQHGSLWKGGTMVEALAPVSVCSGLWFTTPILYICLFCLWRSSATSGGLYFRAFQRGVQDTLLQLFPFIKPISTRFCLWKPPVDQTHLLILFLLFLIIC